MFQIPTLYTNYQELLLDLDILGKILSESAINKDELRDLLFEEYKITHPLPTLEDKRYELSDLVSSDYHIYYANEVELAENEQLVDLGLSDSSDDFEFEGNIVVPESIKEQYSYGSITDKIRESMIEEYYNNDTEEFNQEIKEVEGVFNTVESHATVYEDNSDTDEDVYVLDEEESYEDDYSSDEEESYEDDYSSDEDEEDSYGDDYDSEDSYGDDYSSDEDEDNSDEDTYEDDYSSDEDNDSYGDDYDSEDEEDSYGDDYASEEEEDSYDYNSEDEEDGSDYEEDYSSDEDEDNSYEDDYSSDEDEEESDYSSEEDSYELNESEEDYYEDDYNSEEGSEEVLEENSVNKKEPSITDDIEIEFEEHIERHIEPVPTPIDIASKNKKNNTQVIEKSEIVVNREEEPKDLREFVRKHPRCEVSFALKYFSRKEIEKYLMMGKIIKKGTKLHI